LARHSPSSCGARRHRPLHRSALTMVRLSVSLHIWPSSHHGVDLYPGAIFGSRFFSTMFESAGRFIRISTLVCAVRGSEVMSLPPSCPIGTLSMGHTPFFASFLSFGFFGTGRKASVSQHRLLASSSSSGRVPVYAGHGIDRQQSGPPLTSYSSSRLYVLRSTNVKPILPLTLLGYDVPLRCTIKPFFDDHSDLPTCTFPLFSSASESRGCDMICHRGGIRGTSGPASAVQFPRPVLHEFCARTTMPTNFSSDHPAGLFTFVLFPSDPYLAIACLAVMVNRAASSSSPHRPCGHAVLRNRIVSFFFPPFRPRITFQRGRACAWVPDFTLRRMKSPSDTMPTSYCRWYRPRRAR